MSCAPTVLVEVVRVAEPLDGQELGPIVDQQAPQGNAANAQTCEQHVYFVSEDVAKVL